MAILGRSLLYSRATAWLNGFKQVLIEPLVAHRSVVPFNASILLRFAWLDVLQLNASIDPVESSQAPAV